MTISTSGWLTRETSKSKKKRAKEKKKALKKADRHMRKLKKEQCKKHKNCNECPYFQPTLVMTDTTATYGYFCRF